MSALPHGEIAARPIQHIGYIVDDIPAAVSRWVTTFGAGPFFWLGKNLSLLDARFYGEPCVLDHSAVIGKWGNTFAELMQVHDVSPAGVRWQRYRSQPHQPHLLRSRRPRGGSCPAGISRCATFLAGITWADESIVL